jgi:hypothetical protein
MKAKPKIEANYDFQGAVLLKQMKTKKYRFSQDADANVDGAPMNIH